jgi:hypothetical protein
MEEEFKCEDCGKKIRVKDGKTPNCCGKTMKKISDNMCIQPAHAEHSRPMESEEPCDDGRAG